MASIFLIPCSCRGGSSRAFVSTRLEANRGNDCFLSLWEAIGDTTTFAHQPHTTHPSRFFIAKLTRLTHLHPRGPSAVKLLVFLNPLRAS